MNTESERMWTQLALRYSLAQLFLAQMTSARNISDRAAYLPDKIRTRSLPTTNCTRKLPLHNLGGVWFESQPGYRLY